MGILVENLGAALGVNLTESHVASVRFYGHTSNHDRVIHFRTEHEVARKMATLSGDHDNSVAVWTDSTTLMEGHTAYLPRATSGTKDRALDDHAFYVPYHYHWSMGLHMYGVEEARWEVDDFGAPHAQHDTLHQVWVQFADDAPVNIVDSAAAPSSSSRQ